MILGISDIVDAELNGNVVTYQWRKTPSQVTTSGIQFDVSMSPGNPPPKYWFDAPPLIARAIYQSVDGGLAHGPSVSPRKKYLRKITTQANASTALPMNALLCDYLLYYPTIDDGITDPQVMDNTVALPRYQDGKGVMMLPVTTASRTGGQQFVVTYTNQDGVPGRVTPPVTQNTSTVIGSITGSNTAIENASNPFIPLQKGDSGVRSIQSVQMLGADVGLFTIILVKPITQICFREITVPYEKDFLMMSSEFPEIKDDAYLSFVSLPIGSLAATLLTGDIKVIYD